MPVSPCDRGDACCITLLTARKPSFAHMAVTPPKDVEMLRGRQPALRGAIGGA